ncbi:MAG: hypothetical protein SGI72_05515 [Planctomycetota bacterium]|nr:hypothetical protein [Planctomycetota bacterium]
MRSSLLATCVTACALVGASFALDSQASQPPAQREAQVFTATNRIAVVGASLSAGFRLDGNTDPFAVSKIDLAKIVEASLTAKHEELSNQASAAFFMDPQGSAQRGFEAIAEYKPTLVVALDYLFWFGYGIKKEEQRVPAVERALAALSKIECPILLGDLPDMALASRTPDPVFGRPMLQKAMLPSVETLVLLNAKITEFAKAHPNVVVVPLAELTAKLQSDAEISLRGNTYPKGSIDMLMQGDRLHTTLEGTCAVWVVAVDAWIAHSKDVPASAFVLDTAKLAAKVRGTKKDAVPAGAPSGKVPETPAPK